MTVSTSFPRYLAGSHSHIGLRELAVACAMNVDVMSGSGLRIGTPAVRPAESAQRQACADILVRKQASSWPSLSLLRYPHNGQISTIDATRCQVNKPSIPTSQATEPDSPNSSGAAPNVGASCPTAVRLVDRPVAGVCAERKNRRFGDPSCRPSGPSPCFRGCGSSPLTGVVQGKSAAFGGTGTLPGRYSASAPRPRPPGNTA